MRARDKYLKIFGEVKSLAEEESWTTGLSNMFEWLCWSPDHILGVSKAQYQRLIVTWAQDDEVRLASTEQKLEHIKAKLDRVMSESEASDRDAPRRPGVKSPREALRCSKFQSEDYLNKEFDIFWSLASDAYLDAFYSRFTPVRGGGAWFSRGNSGLFAQSTDIKDMQIDNLSYCPAEGLLIANELKLSGKKNPDQFLKHSLMFKFLKDRSFIGNDARFLLLFIGGKKWAPDWSQLIQEEVEYCEKSTKSTCKAALEAKAVAQSASYASTTWLDVMEFNAKYKDSLHPRSQQVERKLLMGFNETLGRKTKLIQG